jgi:hypothetical protein
MQLGPHSRVPPTQYIIRFAIGLSSKPVRIPHKKFPNKLLFLAGIADCMACEVISKQSLWLLWCFISENKPYDTHGDKFVRRNAHRTAL